MARTILPKRYHVLVIGCGGTGSAFMQGLMPYLVHRGDGVKEVEVSICDGDIVEEKNLVRQVFFPDQVGMNKAVALSESISATFDYAVNVIPHYLESVSDVRSAFGHSYACMPVLVGCVDNLKARAIYEEWFSGEDSAAYIDCANEEFHGEVVYASKFGGKLLSPLRSRVFPSFAKLLEQEKESMKFRSEIDCLARAVSAPQHIFTNKMSALLAVNAVSAMLETDYPPTGVDFFTMRPMAVQHQDTSALLPKETIIPAPASIEKAG